MNCLLGIFNRVCLPGMANARQPFDWPRPRLFTPKGSNENSPAFQCRVDRYTLMSLRDFASCSLRPGIEMPGYYRKSLRYSARISNFVCMDWGADNQRHWVDTDAPWGDITWLFRNPVKDSALPILILRVQVRDTSRATAPVPFLSSQATLSCRS